MKYLLIALLTCGLVSCNTTRPDPLDPQSKFPKLTKRSTTVNETIVITKANAAKFDDSIIYKAGKKLGDLNSQDENQKPVFSIEEDGVKFGPVIVYGGDGVHVRASNCSLKIITLGGEDCITIKSGDNNRITGFSHSRLKDKRIQINSGKNNLVYDYVAYGDQGKLAKLYGNNNQVITAGFKGNRAFGIIADATGKNSTIIDYGGNENARGRKFVLNNGSKLIVDQK